MFVDRAKIIIKSGRGGNGAVTFRRELFVPEGGPDGGDGGKGGDVVFVADHNMHTLMDFKYKHRYEAQNGTDGMKKKRYGKKGEDLVIKVPPGTVIIDHNSGFVMKDLVNPGDSFVAAKGGKGGKGNVHFKNSVRQAPNFAEAGGEAKERVVILELKTIADVGLVGFPNVGKSTILSAATSAAPKIANYHFTTIDPNLGVVDMGYTSFIMADTAGILEGAHRGVGRGIRFLKHIERTSVLIHVVDVSGSEGRDPVDDFDKVNSELEKYSPKLLKKPQIIAANKIDIMTPGSDNLKKLTEHAENKGYKVFPISAYTNQGMKEILEEASKLVQEAEKNIQYDDIEYFDFEKEESDAEYKKIKAYFEEKTGAYVLEGKQLTKIFNSTNLNDIGSLRYLYKYLEKNGVIDELKRLGIRDGDTLCIEDFEFEYFDD